MSGEISFQVSTSTTNSNMLKPQKHSSRQVGSTIDWSTSQTDLKDLKTNKIICYCN